MYKLISPLIIYVVDLIIYRSTCIDQQIVSFINFGCKVHLLHVKPHNNFSMTKPRKQRHH